VKCSNHPDAAAIVLCIGCGKQICESCKISVNGEAYCKTCVEAKTSGQVKQQKTPALAAILNVVLSGTGQVYNGQPGKGLIIFFTSWLIVPWIYGIYDAYKTAERINSGELIIEQRPGCMVASIVVMIMVPIMVVVLAIMAAIAIPAFMAAKEKAQQSMIANNSV